MVAAAFVVLAAGFVNLSPVEARVAAAGSSYFASLRSAKFCEHLSRHRLQKYGSYTVKPGTVAACKEITNLEDPALDEMFASHRGLRIAYVGLHGGRADAHYLQGGVRSFELVLVLEGKQWKVDSTDEDITANHALIGKRFSTTEKALVDAYEAVQFSAITGGATPAEAALSRAVSLTQTYIRLVGADRRLGAVTLVRKLKWMAGEAAYYGCARCSTLLAQAVPATGAPA